MVAPAVSLASAHHGEAIVDGHSPVHALVGFAAGILGMDPHVAMMVFIGARIVEHSLRSGPAHALFGREKGESLGNEMGDLLFEVAGLHYGKMLRDKLVAAPHAPAPTAGIGQYYFPAPPGFGYVNYNRKS